MSWGCEGLGEVEGLRGSCVSRGRKGRGQRSGLSYTTWGSADFSHSVKLLEVFKQEDIA